MLSSMRLDDARSQFLYRRADQPPAAPVRTAATFPLAARAATIEAGPSDEGAGALPSALPPFSERVGATPVFAPASARNSSSLFTPVAAQGGSSSLALHSTFVDNLSSILGAQPSAAQSHTTLFADEDSGDDGHRHLFSSYASASFPRATTLSTTASFHTDPLAPPRLSSSMVSGIIASAARPPLTTTTSTPATSLTHQTTAEHARVAARAVDLVGAFTRHPDRSPPPVPSSALSTDEARVAPQAVEEDGKTLDNTVVERTMAFRAARERAQQLLFYNATARQAAHLTSLEMARHVYVALLKGNTTVSRATTSPPPPQTTSVPSIASPKLPTSSPPLTAFQGILRTPGTRTPSRGALRGRRPSFVSNTDGDDGLDNASDGDDDDNPLPRCSSNNTMPFFSSQLSHSQRLAADEDRDGDSDSRFGAWSVSTSPLHAAAHDGRSDCREGVFLRRASSIIGESAPRTPPATSGSDAILTVPPSAVVAASNDASRASALLTTVRLLRRQTEAMTMHLLHACGEMNCWESPKTTVSLFRDLFVVDAPPMPTRAPLDSLHEDADVNGESTLEQDELRHREAVLRALEEAAAATAVTSTPSSEAAHTIFTRLYRTPFTRHVPAPPSTSVLLAMYQRYQDALREASRGIRADMAQQDPHHPTSTFAQAAEKLAAVRRARLEDGARIRALLHLPQSPSCASTAPTAVAPTSTSPQEVSTVDARSTAGTAAVVGGAAGQMDASLLSSPRSPSIPESDSDGVDSQRPDRTPADQPPVAVRRSSPHDFPSVLTDDHLPNARWMVAGRAWSSSPAEQAAVHHRHHHHHQRENSEGGAVTGHDANVPCPNGRERDNTDVAHVGQLPQAGLCASGAENSFAGSAEGSWLGVLREMLLQHPTATNNSTSPPAGGCDAAVPGLDARTLAPSRMAVALHELRKFAAEREAECARHDVVEITEEAAEENALRVASAWVRAVTDAAADPAGHQAPPAPTATVLRTLQRQLEQAIADGRRDEVAVKPEADAPTPTASSPDVHHHRRRRRRSQQSSALPHEGRALDNSREDEAHLSAHLSAHISPPPELPAPVEAPAAHAGRLPLPSPPPTTTAFPPAPRKRRNFFKTLFSCTR